MDVSHEVDRRSFRYAFAHYKERCRQLILVNGSTAICEIGGGRTPLFTDQEIAELGAEYTILDVSERELQAAPSNCLKVCRDICVPDPDVGRNRYDLMFSRLLAEHVTDAAAMHQNVFDLLRPGGIAFHFFPTLFTPAFVVNRLLPEQTARRVLLALWPSRGDDYPKFPALYSKCFGPIPRMKRFIEKFGYQIEEFRPYYGTGYLAGTPLLRSFESFVTETVARCLGPLLTSYAWLIVRKPVGGSRSAGERTTERSWDEVAR